MPQATRHIGVFQDSQYRPVPPGGRSRGYRARGEL